MVSYVSISGVAADLEICSADISYVVGMELYIKVNTGTLTS